MTTQSLAIAELTLRIIRHDTHVRNALQALGRAKVTDRVRRTGHGTERVTAREWRRVKRHMRTLRTARSHLRQLTTLIATP